MAAVAVNHSELAMFIFHIDEGEVRAVAFVGSRVRVPASDVDMNQQQVTSTMPAERIVQHLRKLAITSVKLGS